MALRKLLRCGMGIMLAAVTLQGLARSTWAGEVSSNSDPAGVVRMSDQRRATYSTMQGPIRPVAFEAGMSCGQTPTSCRVGTARGAHPGACANGACGRGPGAGNACCGCNGSACGAYPGACANGACGRGPGAGNVSCGCNSAGCGRGQCVAGCDCQSRNGAHRPGTCPCCRPPYRTYTFRDMRNTIDRSGDGVGRMAGNLRDSAGDWSEYLDDGRTGAFYELCPEHGEPMCQKCNSWWACQCAMFRARNEEQSRILHAHCKGKLAYFCPMGNCGQGVPPLGWYDMVYAAGPNYFDPRDGQLYAAQGYGVPISVPLAPTVRHTMNYSNGMPSSRLTPISTVIPPRSVWNQSW